MQKNLKKPAYLFLSVFAFLVLCSSSAPAALKAAQFDTLITEMLSSEHIEDELIIKFKSSVSANKLILTNASARVHSKTGAKVKRHFKGLKGVQLLKFPESSSIKKALQDYLTDPDIEYAEPNYIVHAALTPDDPAFTNLWGLNNTGQSGGTVDADIDALEAWDITTGTPDVVIAVIDTGVALNSNISIGHPEVTGNIWTNTGETDCTNNSDDDGNGYVDDCYGWDFLDADNDPMDYAGHGTHVSGTIAATGNNSEGIAGIMWNASIMPLRFLDAAGSGSTADAVSAILYATANGAHVINNSWGGDGFSQTLEDAINASDAVVVCAAGNSGRDNDPAPFYPASYTSDNIISVAATDRNDNLASFSNYGAVSVDIAAPGVSIYSTLPARNQVFFDNMSDLSNWDADAPWGLSSTYYSSPYSASDSPSGDYASNTYASLSLTNYLNISGLRGFALSYIMSLETELDHDYFCIDMSTNGRSWYNRICYHGSTGGYFFFMNEDLTTYDNTKKVYFRFRFISDSANNYDGVYIDNVEFTTYSDTYDGTEYAYYNGTSMAAPHVSGVAGLIKSIDPELTNLEIIDIILASADPLDSLTGKVASNGRLNAYNAVYSASCTGLPVKILSTGSEYSSLQEAYNAAGSGDIIMSHDTTFIEDIIIDLNKTVTFKGGYDCVYNAVTGNTTLNGNISITDGTAAIEGFILEQ